MTPEEKKAAFDAYQKQQAYQAYLAAQATPAESESAPIVSDSSSLPEDKLGAARMANVLDAVTLGTADEFGALVNTYGDEVAQILGLQEPRLKSESYERYLSGTRQALNQYRQERPREAFAGQMAGSVANPLNRVLGGVKAATTTGRIARGAASGAVEGGLYGLGAGEGGLEERLESGKQGALIGGATGAVLDPLTGAVLDDLPSRVTREGEKLQSGAFGINAAKQAKANIDIPDILFEEAAEQYRAKGFSAGDVDAKAVKELVEDIVAKRRPVPRNALTNAIDAFRKDGGGVGDLSPDVLDSQLQAQKFIYVKKLNNRLRDAQKIQADLGVPVALDFPNSTEFIKQTGATRQDDVIKALRNDIGKVARSIQRKGSGLLDLQFEKTKLSEEIGDLAFQREKNPVLIEAKQALLRDLRTSVEDNYARFTGGSPNDIKKINEQIGHRLGLERIFKHLRSKDDASDIIKRLQQSFGPLGGSAFGATLGIMLGGANAASITAGMLLGAGVRLPKTRVLTADAFRSNFAKALAGGLEIAGTEAASAAPLVAAINSNEVGGALEAAEEAEPWEPDFSTESLEPQGDSVGSQVPTDPSYTGQQQPNTAALGLGIPEEQGPLDGLSPSEIAALERQFHQGADKPLSQRLPRSPQALFSDPKNRLVAEAYAKSKKTMSLITKAFESGNPIEQRTAMMALQAELPSFAFEPSTTGFRSEIVDANGNMYLGDPLEAQKYLSELKTRRDMGEFKDNMTWFMKQTQALIRSSDKRIFPPPGSPGFEQQQAPSEKPRSLGLQDFSKDLTGDFSVDKEGDNEGALNLSLQEIESGLSSRSLPTAEMLRDAVIRAESSGNPNAVSPVGAQGLMQLMPATGKEMMRKLGMNPDDYDPFDAELNKVLGTAYLQEQLDAFQDGDLALAAYNMGPTALRKMMRQSGHQDWDSISAWLARKGWYKETVNYVPKVREFQEELMAQAEASSSQS